MQSVLGFYEAPFLHRTAITAIVASLEIIRRGIWNFFRQVKYSCCIPFFSYYKPEKNRLCQHSDPFSRKITCHLRELSSGFLEEVLNILGYYENFNQLIFLDIFPIFVLHIYISFCPPVPFSESLNGFASTKIDV